MLAELSVSAGQVLTNVHLLQRVWGLVVRNIVKRPRRTLGDAPSNPIYIFKEPRVGYRMPKGDDGSSSRVIAPRLNSVVQLREGFKSTAHEHMSISCLL